MKTAKKTVPNRPMSVRDEAARLGAARFYAELSEQHSIASCASVFKTWVARYGFVAIACGEVDLAERSRNVLYIVDWPKSWLKYYESSGFIDRDPVLNALKILRKAFTWSEILRDRRFSNLDREALRYSAQYGWSEGLVVPVPRGGERYGLVSLIGHSKVTAHQRLHICLMSECLLTRVRSLVHKHKFPTAPAGLSEREIESLSLVAQGYSDAAIAKALGISQSTAHKHVEGGRKHLGAKTRAHMAALGLSLGIISGA
jgi:LuxR family quorum sensing-dependent transcriptional regulator